MSKRLVLAIAFIVVIGVAVLWLRPDRSPTTATVPPAPAPASQPAPSPIGAEVRALPSPPTSQSETPAITDPTGTFRTDSTGRLIVDEQTRLAVEALLARTDPADVAKIQEQIIQALPPAAAAEASDLLERYQNYSKAQRQAYPPGIAPATEESALAELDGLHALRVAHFGAETARALYGDEEALTRSLIELMRLEKDQSLTLEEKAARAQQLYDTLPGLFGTQRSN